MEQKYEDSDDELNDYEEDDEEDINSKDDVNFSWGKRYNLGNNSKRSWSDTSNDNNE